MRSCACTSASKSCAPHVSSWHSADVPIALAKVCFEEKSGSGADLPPRRSLAVRCTAAIRQQLGV